MPRLLKLGLLSITVVAISLAVRADDFAAPVSALAQRIASKAGPGTAITLTVKNISSLAAADVNTISTQLSSELRNRGLRVVDAEQSVADVRVTLSENLEAYVWVAEIKQSNVADAVFTTLPRTNSAPTNSAGAITLQGKLLSAQDEPILDIALIGSQAIPGAIVLTPTKVNYYRINGTWQLADSAAITTTRPLPRDLRGMIIDAGNDPFYALLPGMRCTIIGNNPYRSSCADTDDSWPVRDTQPPISAFFSPARNFFTGGISRAGESISVPPFYSGAMLGNSEWLFATTDGRIQYSSFLNTLPVTANWGSELASIKSKCSPDTIVLATRNGDFTQPDAVQGYQVIAREPIAVTTALEFGGPVTVLRSSGESATGVVHNLKTGKYEAYLLTLACTQ